MELTSTGFRRFVACGIFGALVGCTPMTAVTHWDSGLLSRSDRLALFAPDYGFFSGDKNLNIRLGDWQVGEADTDSSSDRRQLGPESTKEIDENTTRHRMLVEDAHRKTLDYRASGPGTPTWSAHCERYDNVRLEVTELRDQNGNLVSDDSELMYSKGRVYCHLRSSGGDAELTLHYEGNAMMEGSLRAGGKTYPLRKQHINEMRDEQGQIRRRYEERDIPLQDDSLLSGYYLDCAPLSPCAALELSESTPGFWVETGMRNPKRDQLIVAGIALWLTNKALPFPG